MFKDRFKVAFLSLLLSGCASQMNESPHEYGSMQARHYDLRLDMVHSISQGEQGVEGLDNVRATALTPDNQQMLVVSADDDSVSIFDLNSGFIPSLRQVFRSGDLYLSSENHRLDSLAGASNLVISADGMHAYIVSFYGSSLLVLSREENGDWSISQLLTDRLSAERIFKDERAIGKLDTLGLLGAWGVDIAPDASQLFVTSYKSSALSVFDLSLGGKAKLRNIIKDSDDAKYGLSGAVGVTVSSDGTRVFTSSFEDNAVAVFTRDKNGVLQWLQTISKRGNKLDTLVNPQSILVSKDNNWLYVACSESGAVMSFKLDGSGLYQHFQTITSIGGADPSLLGAGGLAMTSDGKHLFVTAEMDSSLSYFKVNQDGNLMFKHSLAAIDVTNGQESNSVLKGLSSVMISADEKFVIATAGEADSLIIYRIMKVKVN